MKYIGLFFLFAILFVQHNAKLTQLASVFTKLIQLQKELGISPDFEAILDAIQLVEDHIRNLIDQQEADIVYLNEKFTAENAELTDLISQLKAELADDERKAVELSEFYDDLTQQLNYNNDKLNDVIKRQAELEAEYYAKKQAIEEEVQDKIEINQSIDEVMPLLNDMLSSQERRDTLKGKIQAGGNQQYIGFAQVKVQKEHLNKINLKKRISPQIKALVQLVLSNKQISDSAINLLISKLNQLQDQFEIEIENLKKILVDATDFFNQQSLMNNDLIVSYQEQIKVLEFEITNTLDQISSLQDRINELLQLIPENEAKLAQLISTYQENIADAEQVLADYKDLMSLLIEGKDSILRQAQ